MSERKKILFVINTLSRAGAETALMALFRKLLRDGGSERFDISLFVITGQGEMADEIPDEVTLLNRDYHDESVLSDNGRKLLRRSCIRALLRKGNVFRLFPYLAVNAVGMLFRGDFRADKLMWKVLSDGAEELKEHYDLAVAFIEGGSTYYVADHVDADRKAAFVHIDYEQAGYTRKLDRNCYGKFDSIFAISGEVKSRFLNAYPEFEDRTDIFHNIIDRDRILRMSASGEGFTDEFNGKRIVTLCRLTKQKAVDVSIEAMRIIRDRLKERVLIRWYVFGEGDQRASLEALIEKYGLKDSFFLCGSTENPYPYMAGADIYVHATKYEGKSIAVQEAQILGKPIIASDCSDNSMQILNGIDGILCGFDPEELADSVIRLLDDEALGAKLGRAASEKQKNTGDDTDKLIRLMEQE